MSWGERRDPRLGRRAGRRRASLAAVFLCLLTWISLPLGLAWLPAGLRSAPQTALRPSCLRTRATRHHRGAAAIAAPYAGGRPPSMRCRCSRARPCRLTARWPAAASFRHTTRSFRVLCSAFRPEAALPPLSPDRSTHAFTRPRDGPKDLRASTSHKLISYDFDCTCIEMQCIAA